MATASTPTPPAGYPGRQWATLPDFVALPVLAPIRAR